MDEIHHKKPFSMKFQDELIFGKGLSLNPQLFHSLKIVE
jgi:hypothetical protein